MSSFENRPHKTVFLNPRQPDELTPITDENKFENGSFGPTEGS